MHIVNQIQRIDVQSRKPIHHAVKLFRDLRVIQRTVPFNRAVFGRNLQRLSRFLVKRQFVPPAVDCVKQALCQVRPRAEELHILSDPHTAHTAGNAIIVAHLGEHQIVAFILDCGSFDRNLRAEFFEVFRQTLAPEHG